MLLVELAVEPQLAGAVELVDCCFDVPGYHCLTLDDQLDSVDQAVQVDLVDSVDPVGQVDQVDRAVRVALADYPVQTDYLGHFVRPDCSVRFGFLGCFDYLDRFDFLVRFDFPDFLVRFVLLADADYYSDLADFPGCCLAHSVSLDYWFVLVVDFDPVAVLDLAVECFGCFDRTGSFDYSVDGPDSHDVLLDLVAEKFAVVECRFEAPVGFGSTIVPPKSQGSDSDYYFGDFDDSDYSSDRQSQKLSHCFHQRRRASQNYNCIASIQLEHEKRNRRIPLKAGAEHASRL